MTRYNTSSIEDIFLHLSQKQQQQNDQPQQSTSRFDEVHELQADDASRTNGVRIGVVFWFILLTMLYFIKIFNKINRIFSFLL